MVIKIFAHVFGVRLDLYHAGVVWLNSYRQTVAQHFAVHVTLVVDNDGDKLNALYSSKRFTKTLTRLMCHSLIIMLYNVVIRRVLPKGFEHAWANIHSAIGKGSFVLYRV